jgi:hypothetical protein
MNALAVEILLELRSHTAIQYAGAMRSGSKDECAFRRDTVRQLGVELVF